MSGDIWPDQLLQMFDPAVSNVVGLIDIGPEPSQAGVEPANMTGTWLLGIPEGSKNKDRAFDYMLWFTAFEQQKKLLLQKWTWVGPAAKRGMNGARNELKHRIEDELDRFEKFQLGE